MELGAAAGLQQLGPELESFHASLRDAALDAASGGCPAAEGLCALPVLAASPLLEWARQASQRPGEGEGAEGGRTAALLALLDDLQQDRAAAEQHEQQQQEQQAAEGDAAGLPAASSSPLGVAVVASGPRVAAALCARLKAACSGQVSLFADASSGNSPADAEAGGSNSLTVTVFTAAEVVSPAAVGVLACCQDLVW